MSTVFRIVPAADWPAVEAAGAMAPSPLDEADGFIHLSDVDTVLETARRYYPPETHPMVLEINADVLGEALRWEHVASRDAHFPHLYAFALRLDAVVALHELLPDNGGYRWGRRVPR